MRPTRPLLENLESRTLLTAAFTDNSIAATWGWAGTGGAGTATFDNAGAYSGTLPNTLAGPPAVLNGAYVLSNTGALTLNSPSNLAGAMTGTQNVIAVAEGGAANSLAILSKQGTGFTNADLVGKFSLFADGPTATTTAVGTIRFDGAGHVVSGSLRDRLRTTPVKTGTYTVADDGSVSATIVYGFGNNTTSQTYTGSLSAGTDLLTLNPTALDAAATRMLVAVKSAGTYGIAALAGTWTLAGDGVEGSITTDGLGRITGGTVIDVNGNTNTAGGTYIVNAAGTLTLNLRLTSGGVAQTRSLSGAINAEQNVAAVEARPGTTSGNSLLVLVNSGNHAPTISRVTAFRTATAAVPFTITFAQLLAASDASDLDGDAISFVIDRIPVNADVTVNGAPAAPGTFISPGDTVVWTGPIQKAGVRTAFMVRAFDGAEASATAAPVRVHTILKGSVGVLVTKGPAREIDGNTAGAGTFRFTRLLGDYSVPLTVAYTVSGTASNDGSDFLPILAGTIVIPANQRSVTLTINPIDDGVPEGNERLKITVINNPGDEYLVNPFKDDATLTILDNS